MKDTLLLWRLKRGRKDALRRIYEKYCDDMLTLAVAMVRDKAAAEDIVHDVFVTLARSAAKTGHIRNLKAYLMTCVANRAKELLASRTRQTAAPADEPAAECGHPIDALIDDEVHRQLIAAMDQLPYEQREVILLHLRAGLTFKMIAGHQGVSINTAQGRYRYGLDKLRSIMNGKMHK
jgi:RNA polymerase sigma-70 factor (ECF subfamily)